ncbi:MAG: hypothetical protein ACRC4W_08615 [Treponemataceae bacterium]
MVRYAADYYLKEFDDWKNDDDDNGIVECAFCGNEININVDDYVYDETTCDGEYLCSEECTKKHIYEKSTIEEIAEYTEYSKGNLTFETFKKYFNLRG